ncbi:MAG: VOC family protein [Rubrivivax sp.]|nr:VOC family protein [Rubrivivax sp.]
MTVWVDHLVVAAATLAQGVAWCEATLGVVPGPGGRHALFGTHNRLAKMASEAYPDAYLEIIAVDPDAPPPGRVRWFGLDDPALQAKLQQHGPRLVHVVARSTMLDMHRWGLINVGLQPGDPVSAHRETPEGRLAWQILVRADGRLLCGGALPTLIQWQGRHPTAAMAASGLALQALTLRGVPERARDVLRLRGVQVLADGTPALSATLATPRGEIVLESA